MFKRRGALVAGLVFVAVGLAQAASSTSCTTGSFGSYRTLGLCSVGTLDFYNFELYTLDPSNVATAADSTLLGNIILHPTWDGVTATMTVDGFTGFAVASGATAAWRIRFTVDPPPIILDDDAALDPPFGEILVTHSVCADGGTSGGCATGVQTQQFGIGGNAHFTFTPAVSVLDVVTDIRLNPHFATTGIASGFDGIVFAVGTTATPEPGTWMLLFPIAGVVLRNRLRRK